MYISKKECLDRLYQHDTQFFTKCASQDNVNCRFEMSVKITNEEDKYIMMLLQACTAACFRLAFVDDVQFVGNVSIFADETASINDVIAVAKTQKGNYGIDLNTAGKIEGYKGTEIVKGGRFTGTAIAALETAKQIAKTQLLNYMYIANWNGLYEADNQYGFEIDYGSEEDEYDYEALSENEEPPYLPKGIE